MTMVLDRHNLPINYQGQQEHPPGRLLTGAGGVYGGYAPAGGNFYHHGVGIGLAIADLSMAEQESQASRGDSPRDVVLEPGSKGFRGKDEDEEDEGWLQLSIGVHTCKDHSRRKKSEESRDGSTLDRRDLVELDLLPPRRDNSASVNKLKATNSLTMSTIGPATGTASSPLHFLHQYGGSSGSDVEFLQQETTESNSLRFRQVIRSQGLIGGAGLPRSSNPSYPTSWSPSLPFSLPYIEHPHLLQLRGADRGAGPSMGTIKIIDPPWRPHSGIWFMLQASRYQATESCLPQIPKSYLRIKDGRMTVRLLTKYLVNKLELNSEFEIEITCRGQELQPYLTLQHVRDNIWIPPKDSTTATATSTTTSASTSRVATLRPESTTTTQQHLMVLNYSRRRRRITTPTAMS